MCIYLAMAYEHTYVHDNICMQLAKP